MLYLEDFLELIEPFPQEIRERLTEMREIDLQIQNETDKLDDRIQMFFQHCKKQKAEWKNENYEEIRKEYSKLLENADDKIQIANQLHDLIEKYLKKLDQEIQKFKLELEADNAGITSRLEQVISNNATGLGLPGTSNADLLAIMGGDANSSLLGNFGQDDSDFTLISSSNNDLMFMMNQSSNNNNNNNQSFNNHDSSASNRRINKHLSTSSSITSAANATGAHHHHHSHHHGHHLMDKNTKDDEDSCSSWNSSTRIDHQNSYSSLNRKNSTNSFVSMNKKNLSFSGPSTINNPSLLPAANFVSLSNKRVSLQAPRNKRIKSDGKLSRKKRIMDMDEDDDDVYDDGAGGGGETGGGANEYDMPPSDDINDSNDGLGSELTSDNDNNLPSRPTTAAIVNGELSDFDDATSDDLDSHHQNKIKYKHPQPTRNPRHIKDDWSSNDDTNEKYCICKDVSYGDMIACDNVGCSTQWFHFTCVGLNAAPKGKWFCPNCVEMKKKRREKLAALNAGVASSSSITNPINLINSQFTVGGPDSNSNAETTQQPASTEILERKNSAPTFKFTTSSSSLASSSSQYQPNSSNNSSSNNITNLNK